MRFLSAFTGVGMFDKGLMDAGFEPPVAQIEIDAHCQSVLLRQFPDVPKFKDIHDVKKESIDDPFDLLVGGSPCQSFSVAGRREGMEGESQLWYEYHRLLVEHRPTWFIWENVPGVLSSGPVDTATGNKRKGIDFAIVLSGFTGVVQTIPRGGWRNSGIANGLFYNVAWRTLDARYFGVPQRRRRIFVVGHLAAAGGSPAEILFECESLSWHLPPRKTAKKVTTAAAGGTAPTSGRRVSGQDVHADAAASVAFYDVAPTLAASGSRTGSSDTANEFLVTTTYRRTDIGTYVEDDSAATLRESEAKDPKRTLIGTTMYRDVIAATLDVRNMVTNDEISGTLQSKKTGGWSLNYQNPVIAFNGDATTKFAHGEALSLRSTLNKSGVILPLGIRRFTPVETERLQGLPDDWTRWRGDGREQSDAQRYSQCGNGGAVPVLEWIGRRILTYKEEST